METKMYYVQDNNIIIKYISYVLNIIHITFLFLGPIYMKSLYFECDFYKTYFKNNFWTI